MDHDAFPSPPPLPPPLDWQPQERRRMGRVRTVLLTSAGLLVGSGVAGFAIAAAATTGASAASPASVQLSSGSQYAQAQAAAATPTPSSSGHMCPNMGGSSGSGRSSSTTQSFYSN